MDYSISYTAEVIFLVILIVAGFIGTQVLSIDKEAYKYQALFFIGMFLLFWTISFFKTKNGAEHLFNEMVTKASKTE